MDWRDVEEARNRFYGELALLQSEMMRGMMPADEWASHLRAAQEAKAKFMQLVFNEIMRIDVQLGEVQR